MSTEFDISNQDHRVARIKSLATAIRQASAKAHSLSRKPASIAEQVREEVKAIRSRLSPRENDLKSNADIEPDARRAVRERYVDAFQGSVRAVRAQLQQHGQDVDSLFAYVRKPKLPTITIAPHTSNVLGEITNAKLDRLYQQMALINARAEIADLTLEERLALLQETNADAQPELVYLLDRAVERDLNALRPKGVGDAIYEAAAKGLRTEEALKAASQAKAAWQERVDSSTTTLETLRVARVSPEERAAFDEWNQAFDGVAREWGNGGSQMSYANTVHQQRDLAEGAPANAAAA
jgi:hypothetical protein